MQSIYESLTNHHQKGGETANPYLFDSLCVLDICMYVCMYVYVWTTRRSKKGRREEEGREINNKVQTQTQSPPKCVQVNVIYPPLYHHHYFLLHTGIRSHPHTHTQIIYRIQKKSVWEYHHHHQHVSMNRKVKEGIWEYPNKPFVFLNNIHCYQYQLKYNS